MSISGIQSSVGSNLAILLQNMQLSGTDKTQAKKAAPPPPPPQKNQSLEQILLLIGDTDGDGKISEAEREAMEEKFASVMAAITDNMTSSSATSSSSDVEESDDSEASISSILESLGTSQSDELSDQSSASLLAIIFSNGTITSKEDLQQLLLQANVDLYA
ncbi:MAG: hypothetical protein NTY09_14535 [bacterium]|nr:hypothetical protein [bacterium]